MEFVGIAGALGVFAFFGGIALIVWASSKSEMHKRELQHAERMKALELGQPLPDADVARAHAEGSRARAAGAIGIVVPLALVAGAVIASTVIWQTQPPGWFVSPLAMLAVIWGVCGLVSLTTVVLSLSALRRAPMVRTEVKFPRNPAPTESPEEAPRPANTSFVASEQPS